MHTKHTCMHITDQCEKYPSHTAIQNHKWNSDTVPCYPTIIQTFLSSKFDHQSLPEILWAHLHHLTVGLLRINTGKKKSQHAVNHLLHHNRSQYQNLLTLQNYKVSEGGFCSVPCTHLRVDIRKRSTMNLKNVWGAADVHRYISIIHHTHTHTPNRILSEASLPKLCLSLCQ